MSDKMILEEQLNNSVSNLLSPIISDGYFISEYKKELKKKQPFDIISQLSKNALDAMRFFACPHSESSKSKILALGKVQSGKTSFFITTIAYAFDNDYDVCILFGGTKTNLMEQNHLRLVNVFEKNLKIKIHTLKQTNHDVILNDLKNGFKVIITVLKNVSSKKTNLYDILELSNLLVDYATLIIDDEADEHTPGAPKKKIKNPRVGITHDVVSDILDCFKIVTIMFVTATPQANLLLSTLDELSPDYITLVEPGSGYTGGEAFHDYEDNPHVVITSDADDFNNTIPDSYKRALKFFMLAVSEKNVQLPNVKFSMLIHPSSLTNVQNAIVDKIKDDLKDLIDILLVPRNIYFEDIKEEFKSVYDSDFTEHQVDFEVVFSQLLANLGQFKIFVLNTSSMGKDSRLELLESDSVMFKIFVGGNMFGRGITLENLCVTYIYRDSKKSAIDTLYQRARWFGYKEDYFDICRVFMTKDLNKKFIAAAENERDMWQSLTEFLLTDIKLKNFKRIFTLNHDHTKLMLTRQTVSKTVVLEQKKSGYNYDQSIVFKPGAVEKNMDLIGSLIEKYKDVAFSKIFSKNDFQEHLIIEDKYTSLYDQFISKFLFQNNSLLGQGTFKEINKQVKNNVYEDKISIVIMRYKTGQFRSTRYGGNELKQLPQGYDPGSNYPGDRGLPELSKVLHLQIHLVYIDKNRPDQKIPILALNNPLTAHIIKYVTGDNIYETV